MPARGPRVMIGAMRMLWGVLAAAVLVAGCAGPAATAPGTALERALARIDAPFEDHLAFADRAALPDTPAWRSAGEGVVAWEAVRFGADLGIDVDAADTVLVVGQPPREVTLLAGGQDGGRVRDAARARGWSGSGVLRRDLDLREPLTLRAGTLRPLGGDLAFGGPTAPVDVVTDGGGALAGDPAVAPLAQCLGEVAVAAVAGGRSGAPRAVGVRADTGSGTGEPAAVSVVCATGTSAAAVREAVTSGASARTGLPWSEHLAAPQVDELPGGVVRLVARHAPGTPPGFVLSALTTRDLPGVPAR